MAALFEPGKPIQNAVIDGFYGRFRDECLNQHWVMSLEEVQQTVEAWRLDYTMARPHRALGQQTPAAWEATWAPASKAPG